MANLPESVTMSTSGSSDAALDGTGANGGIGHLEANEQHHLDAARRKLREGGHDPAVLPRAINDNLWEQYQSTFGLTLVEMTALKNSVVAPAAARPRGVLRRIDDATLYRISDQRIRASFIISNTINGCRYNLQAELLVDPGANTDLKLPARKVMQLGLVPFGRPTLARGSTNSTTFNMHFSPVRVTATFDRHGTTETIEAYLDVKCDKNEYEEALRAQQDEGITPRAGTNDEQSSVTTPNQPTGINAHPTASSTNHENITVIHLSPTRHRPSDAPLQQAVVIGIDGLHKLRLHLNCDQLQLEIEEDELVEDEEATASW